MADQPGEKPSRPCPICGKPAVERYRPFCSVRCADVDLNRWLSGVYVIPGTPVLEEDALPTGDGEDQET